MTDFSIQAIEKLVVSTSKSKDEAEKTIRQFRRLDNTAKSFFEKVFSKPSRDKEPPC